MTDDERYREIWNTPNPEDYVLRTLLTERTKDGNPAPTDHSTQETS